MAVLRTVRGHPADHPTHNPADHPTHDPTHDPADHPTDQPAAGQLHRHVQGCEPVAGRLPG
ncbi:PT domain-containing protein [Micromonospora sp. NPDC049374]|uniref:PT domain-containing protein n=1 Tax=Micromonospora sp. NPDC049374 TaxID=3154352 RepID=UPI0034413855